jgi:hypothetical protein
MNQIKEFIIPTMIEAAEKATIQTHPVRRNISILEEISSFSPVRKSTDNTPPFSDPE